MKPGVRNRLAHIPIDYNASAMPAARRRRRGGPTSRLSGEGWGRDRAPDPRSGADAASHPGRASALRLWRLMRLRLDRRWHGGATLRSGPPYQAPRRPRPVSSRDGDQSLPRPQEAPPICLFLRAPGGLRFPRPSRPHRCVPPPRAPVRPSLPSAIRYSRGSWRSAVCHGRTRPLP